MREKTNGLRAGSARGDITPPLNIPYLGFDPRQALFEGVHDHLHVRVLVLDDGAMRVAIISCDALGFGEDIVGRGTQYTRSIRHAVAGAAGCPSENVMVASTHAHSTPETLGITPVEQLPAFRDWMSRVRQIIAGAAAEASRGMERCTPLTGSDRLIGVSHNRRPRWRGVDLEEQVRGGVLDPAVQVLLLADGRGEPAHVVVGFQCHPVIMQVQPQVSADFPGVLCRTVEETLPGCRSCMFLQGASGNTNPICDDSRDFQDVENLGRRLAGVAVGLITREGSLEDTGRQLGVRWEQADLPGRTVPEVAALRRELAEAEQEIGPQSAASRRRAREALRLAVAFARPRRVGVQTLRLGETAVVAIPGELFTEWGLRIKDSSLAEQTFIAAPANGWAGYLVNPGAFAEGGYEPGLGPWTQTDEEGARRIFEAAVRGVGALWPERPIVRG